MNLRLIQLNDRVLKPLLTATSDDARQREVERLIVAVAEPVAGGVIERFSAEEWRIDPEAANDIAATISMRLLQKLDLVTAFEEEAIERFDDYVEILAQHTVYDYLRKRFPARSRLRNRLRYLFSHDKRFVILSSAGGTLVALRQWRVPPEPAQSIDVDISSRMLNAKKPAEALGELLKRVGKPVRLELLVSKVAELWNIADVDRDDSAPQLAQTSAIDRFETRQSVELLWQEIRDLPPLQRAALLLNLREPGGFNAISHFVILGITTVDAIAGAVGMSAQSLADLWNDLPLDDLTIAERLGMKRQQVINLRKAARERLTRRMAARARGAKK